MFDAQVVNISKGIQRKQMFKENDAVWIKSSELKGSISYMEEGYIEVVLENGVEVSFHTFENLEPYKNQVATPKIRVQTYSDIFQSQLDEAV